jgi:hypothetical protein
MSQESIQNNIDELIRKIMIQTTYNEDESRQKLIQHNYDIIKVLREFMGIKEDKKDDTKIKSINQEIFKQIRYTLDSSMKEYREKNPLNIEEVTERLNESDKREKQKDK